MHSEQIAGQFRQFAAFAFFERDVGEQRLADHAVDEVAQTVRQRIQIRMVDLLDVAGEDDLCPFAGSRDDRLDFVRVSDSELRRR